MRGVFWGPDSEPIEVHGRNLIELVELWMAASGLGYRLFLANITPLVQFHQ